MLEVISRPRTDKITTSYSPKGKFRRNPDNEASEREKDKAYMDDIRKTPKHIHMPLT